MLPCFSRKQIDKFDYKEMILRESLHIEPRVMLSVKKDMISLATRQVSKGQIVNCKLLTPTKSIVNVKKI